MSKQRSFLIFMCAVLLHSEMYAQTSDLDLIEAKDLDLLLQDEPDKSENSNQSLSQDELDDLESLKQDIGDLEKDSGDLTTKIQGTNDILFEDEEVKNKTIVNKDTLETKTKDKTKIFDVGSEEAELLKVSKFIEKKIPAKEWNEIALASKQDKYVVQEGEWLWKISERLFGSGFYYAKIWSLNPYITNPHEIKSGMSLVFSTGSEAELPEVAIGSFEEQVANVEDVKTKEIVDKDLKKISSDFSQWGENAKPPWLEEKQKLLKQGVYIQYGSSETYEDLIEAAKSSLVKEYENYEPPQNKIILDSEQQQYDELGFDKNSKLNFNFKEGYYLNTFLSQNIVQDYGFIKSARDQLTFTDTNIIYAKFDADLKIAEGDLFSTYSAGGKYSHKLSDRSGYKYTITGHLKALRRLGDLWECEVFDTTNLVKREDRITVYTPKIDKIIKTFNNRNVEAAVIGSYDKGKLIYSFGDVVYLDRGRADGVELGNVFEVYSFEDRITEKKITPNPTYKIGEITVITLTDNFATGLVSSSSMDIKPGNVAITKSKEDAARDSRIKNQLALKDVKKIEAKSLEELDVELNLDNLNESLLKKADSIRLSEDELEELERQEREKSVLKDHERDLKALERLETEIESAEKILNEAKADEDKLLEQHNLNDVENAKKLKLDEMNDLEGLEQQLGKKYMDEDLNKKENPYGLTEFDIEEVDELLNSESTSAKK